MLSTFNNFFLFFEKILCKMGCEAVIQANRVMSHEADSCPNRWQACIQCGQLIQVRGSFVLGAACFDFQTSLDNIEHHF